MRTKVYGEELNVETLRNVRWFCIQTSNLTLELIGLETNVVAEKKTSL